MLNFNLIQDEIYDLLATANTKLPPDLALYYGHTYLTGCTHNPEVLFVGANPGHLDWDDRKMTEPQHYSDVPCKFIEEYTSGAALSRRIVDVFFEGDVDRLHNCAETSAYSFFATPCVNILDKQLDALRSIGLFDRHVDMMRTGLLKIIDELKPNKVVCIGVEVFDEVRLVCGSKDAPVTTGKLENRRLYLETELDGTPLIGVLHLSGAQPSRKELDFISAHFR